MFDGETAPATEAPSPPPRVVAEAVAAELVELSAHINAAEARFLELVARFDRERLWAWHGASSCAHWLNWQCGLGRGAARERVRTARALETLPRMRAAFARGEISYSKVRELTRVAIPETEDDLLNIARYGTAAHVQKVARLYRKVERLEEAAASESNQARRFLHHSRDDDGMLTITVRLPVEVGEVVLRALDAAREELYQDGMSARSGNDDWTHSNVPAETRHRFSDSKPPGGHAVVEELAGESGADSIAMRRADALRLLAESFLASGASHVDTSADRHQVVVHISQSLLAGSDDARAERGRCETEAGHVLAQDTARRLACDAAVVGMVTTDDGEPLNLGRKTRVPSPALRRALHARDGGCVFPGCGRTLFTHAHHIVHWANGGETKLSNLVTLCTFHHRLVHEGGFSVTRNGDGSFIFVQPDGEPLPTTGRLCRGAIQELRKAALYGEVTVKKLNRNRGLEIDRRTAACLWSGERLDYHLAIGGLIQTRDRARARAALTAEGT